MAGVWPPDATSPLDVTSCCRSIEGSLLATSDGRGDVKLFRWVEVQDSFRDWCMGLWVD